MRKNQAVVREVPLDTVYQNRDVSRIIRKVMKGGKMSVAERLVYAALNKVQKATEQDPMNVLMKAVKNITPEVEVKSKRIGGANLQVPVEVRPRRQKSLAIRWLVTYARSRRERGFAEKLAQEIIDAYHERGGAYKKKTDVLRMAEANRTFASFG